MAKKQNTKPEKEPVQTEAVEEEVTEAAAQTAEPEEDIETKLLKQLQQKDEQLLRLAAEYDNFRKRTAKEKAETYALAKAAVLESFLEVADNFERAKDATGNAEDYKKGIAMIFGQLLEKMREQGVEPFGEAGESFDPELHMAVLHVEDDQKGEGEIVEVLQKGYKIGEKVLRHAMVKVAN